MAASDCHPERRAYGKGLCSACYQRQWRDPERARGYTARWKERHRDELAARRAKEREERAARRPAMLAAKRDAYRADVHARLAERFWSKVVRGEGCWIWAASVDDHGYGRFGIGRLRIEPAHRVAWMVANGPIPDGLSVLHRCDNPPCVRPDHLFLGTQRDNMRDMIAKGRGGGQFQRRSA